MPACCARCGLFASVRVMTSITSPRLLRPFLLAAALATGVATTGCGTSITGICDDFCDCEGCSDREYDDCMDDLVDTEDEAYDAGCGDEYDIWLSCVDAEWEFRGGDKFDIGKRCDPEFRDLAQCAD